MTTQAMILPVSDDEIVERASALPRIDGYPSVDELLERLEQLRRAHPELLTVKRVGTSRRGEPIPLYTLRDGQSSRDRENQSGADPKQCLIVGGVHPNEPIGSHTIVCLLTDLLQDASLRERLNTEWHIIPCADPDGMRLNEGWFDDPTDRENYFRHFYRPPGNEQVEWTFPISYKARYFDAMLPETQALQRVIDELRPDFYIPLHNSESGGAYFYLSEDIDELVALLRRLPAEAGIPLHLGEPEGPHFRLLAPAVFESSTPEAVYEWREANGLDPAPAGAAGQSSTSYVHRYGTVSLIAELPIWRTTGADDTSPSPHGYADLLHEAGDALVHSGTQLSALLDQLTPHLTLDTPFLRSAQVFVPGMVRSGELMLTRAAMAENQRIATVAERPMAVVWMYRLRFGGALLRALNAEVSAGTADVAVRRAAAELGRTWDRWLQQWIADEAPEGIDVRDVVSVQYGAIVGLVSRGSAIDHARDNAQTTEERR